MKQISDPDFGYKAKVRKLKATFYYAIHKGIVRGAFVDLKDRLHAYSCKDKDNRSIIVIYLDGKDWNGKWEKQ